jgi:DNA ligase-4
LYDVVSKRSSVVQGSLSIDDVNEILDSLADSMGKQDKQSKILQRVYNRAAPDEQRWIVRIILKGNFSSTCPMQSNQITFF